MIQPFVRWGNSIALRIPSAYAKDMNVTEGTEAELTLENGRLVVTPKREFPVYDLDELVSGITPENLHAEFSTGHAVGEEFA